MSLVTPLDKNNGDVFTLINNSGYRTALDQSSGEGSGFTYSSYRAFANPQSAPYTNQYLARRDPATGWATESLAPPRSGQFSTELENEFKAFSVDLSSGWMLQEGEPPLDPCAPAGFFDLYRRDSAGGAYEALSCAKPSHDTQHFIPELQGFSADGSKAVFRVDDKLAVIGSPQAAPSPPFVGESGNHQLYMSTGGGQLRLISILPDGKASAGDTSAGTALDVQLPNHNRLQNVEGAVSADGTRTFWSIREPSGSGPLYLRLNADQAQSKVAAGKCTEATKGCTIEVTPEPAEFQKGNPEGTKALYKVTDGPLEGNLYEFDASVEPPTTRLIAEGIIKHIAGAGADLSHVYFASEEASAAEEAEGAVKGKPNLYLAENGSLRFVGLFSSYDLSPQAADPATHYGSPIVQLPIFRTASASADGATLAFTSNSRELERARRRLRQHRRGQR